MCLKISCSPNFFHLLETPIQTSFFLETSVISSPRIRWGSVDIVIGTPELFLRDLERSSVDGIYPSSLIFDEVDFHFHNNATRKQIMDILNFIRPRPLIQIPNLHKQKVEDIKECQVIAVGATIPHMGVISVGSMLQERFSTAIIVTTSNIHKISPKIHQRWILLDENRILKNYYCETKLSKSSEKTSTLEINPIIESYPKGKKNMNEEKIDESTSEYLHTEGSINELLSDPRKENCKEYKKASFEHRLDILISILKKIVSKRTIVLVNTIQECKNLYKILKQNDWPVYSYNKAMSMCTRMHVLRTFFSDVNCSQSKDCKQPMTEFSEKNPADFSFRILIMTDLASRGIDMRNVDHFINFHFPTDTVTYLHRSGRIARLSPCQDKSLKICMTNLVSKEDMKLVDAILKCQKIGKSLQSTFSRRRSFKARIKLEEVNNTVKEDIQHDSITVNGATNTQIHKFLGKLWKANDHFNADTHSIESMNGTKDEFFQFNNDTSIDRKYVDSSNFNKIDHGHVKTDYNNKSTEFDKYSIKSLRNSVFNEEDSTNIFLQKSKERSDNLLSDSDSDMDEGRQSWGSGTNLFTYERNESLSKINTGKKLNSDLVPEYFFGTTDEEKKVWINLQRRKKKIPDDFRENERSVNTEKDLIIRKRDNKRGSNKQKNVLRFLLDNYASEDLLEEDDLKL